MITALTAAGAVGCGGDDDSGATERTDVSAAAEPAESFIRRFAKLLETTTRQRDCLQLHQVNFRSVTQFRCPSPKELRQSMASFEVIGVREYGVGAVVDYKSAVAKDGAAITMHVARDRNWGIGRFGIVAGRSVDSSDADSRGGFRVAVADYLDAVRRRDCDAYLDVAFVSDLKPKEACEQRFSGTARVARLLKRNPETSPVYEGGNASFGFFSLELPKPKPSAVTISVAKAHESAKRDYVVLDMYPGPTRAQREKAVKRFREELRQRRSSMNPDEAQSSGRKAD